MQALLDDEVCDAAVGLFGGVGPAEVFVEVGGEAFETLEAVFG